MNSTILQIASKYIRFILVLFSILALFRGHNHPGGGFIGGLIAALSIAYLSYAYSVKTAINKLLLQPQAYIVIGLSLVLLSLVPSMLTGHTLMYGEWLKIPITDSFTFKIGTPFVFDIGVFFTVIGVTLLFLFSLINKD